MIVGKARGEGGHGDEEGADSGVVGQKTRRVCRQRRQGEKGLRNPPMTSRTFAGPSPSAIPAALASCPPHQPPIRLPTLGWALGDITID